MWETVRRSGIQEREYIKSMSAITVCNFRLQSPIDHGQISGGPGEGVEGHC